jgi:Crp-like helix-turn-helix protein
MVGTTQFTVSRVLCQWAAQGIIEPDRKAILIENLEALMEVAAAES